MISISCGNWGGWLWVPSPGTILPFASLHALGLLFMPYGGPAGHIGRAVERALLTAPCTPCCGASHLPVRFGGKVMVRRIAHALVQGSEPKSIVRLIAPLVALQHVE